MESQPHLDDLIERMMNLGYRQSYIAEMLVGYLKSSPAAPDARVDLSQLQDQLDFMFGPVL